MTAAIQQSVPKAPAPKLPLNEATKAAQETTFLSPRFYTTNFEELDRTGQLTILRRTFADVGGAAPRIDPLEPLVDDQAGHGERDDAAHGAAAEQGFGAGTHAT